MTPTSGADAIFARRASRKRVMTAESDGDEAEHGSDAVRASMSFWRSAEETVLLMAKLRSAEGCQACTRRNNINGGGATPGNGRAS